MDTQTLQGTALKAKFFRGLSDTSRLAILEMLRSGSLTVSVLVERTGLSQSNVSNHLSYLRDCGLVVSSQQGRHIYYQLSDERVAFLLNMAEELLADAAQDIYERTRYEESQARKKELPMDEEQEYEADDIKRYLQEIGQIPHLTPEEEKQIIQHIEQGRTAQQQLIQANLRLVVSIAGKYRGQGMKLFDLILAGNQGLCQAAEKFDGAKEYSFSTYATWWIRQAITKALVDTK